MASQANLYSTTKYLSSNITSNTTGVASLAVSDLIVGRKYKVTISPSIAAQSVNFLSIAAIHNGSQIGIAELTGAGTASNNSIRVSRELPEFIATTKSLSFNAVVNSSGTIRGNGTLEHTYITVNEVPFSNTAINTGPIFLEEISLTSSQANAPITARVFQSGKFIRMLLSGTLTGGISGDIDLTIPTRYLPRSTRVRSLGNVTFYDVGGQVYEASGVLTNTGTNISLWSKNAATTSNRSVLISNSGCTPSFFSV